MTKLTNLIIVDASGSMGSKKPEVIGSLKQLFEQITKDAKNDEKKVISATIVTDFSSAGDFRTLVDTKDSLEIDGKVADNYATRGSTALFDAIAKSFGMVPDKQDSVFVTIITDGEENDSKEMKHDAVKKLIEEKRAENWVITFMGTSEDAIEQAKSIGISAGNTFSYEDSTLGFMEAGEKFRSARGVFYASNTAAGADTLRQKGQLKMDNLLNEVAEKDKNLQDYLKKDDTK